MLWSVVTCTQRNSNCLSGPPMWRPYVAPPRGDPTWAVHVASQCGSSEDLHRRTRECKHLCNRDCNLKTRLGDCAVPVRAQEHVVWERSDNDSAQPSRYFLTMPARATRPRGGLAHGHDICWRGNYALSEIDTSDPGQFAVIAGPSPFGTDGPCAILIFTPFVNRNTPPQES